MIKTKHLLAVTAAAAFLCLAGCGTETTDTAKTQAVKQAESIDMLTFTAQMNDKDVEIGYWGDGTDTYYFFLPSGCSPAQLSVTTQNGITLRKEEEDESARVSFANGETFDGIECGITYLLGCLDQNDYIYELPVVFLQGANIHSTFITTESGSIDAVLADKDYKENGSMIITDPEGHVVYDDVLAYVKGRGNGSWYSHKKPFNLKLSQAADLLGMGVAREWCLLSQEPDLSCLRNKIAYDLAADAGMAYSPDSEFTDLWIDGQYYGLYLLTDRIDVSDASVDITHLEKATEAVNLEELKSYPLETVLTAKDTPENCRQFVNIPNDPEDITGGYLLEVDKFYPQHKTSRFPTGSVFSVTLKSPKYASKGQLEYISDFVSNMEKAINTPGSLAYQKYLDMDSWAQMCTLEELLADGDYMGSSQYFYKDVDTESGRSLLHAGPVWDKDYALGNSNAGNYIASHVLLAPSRTWIKNLYSRPEFYNQVVAAYQETFRPLALQLLESRIDAYAAQIADSVKMNNTRWAAVFKDRPASFYQDDLQELKDFIAERIELLDDLWLNNAVYHSVRITANTSVFEYEDLYDSLDYMVPHGEALGVLDPPVAREGYLFEGWIYGTPTKPGGPYDPAAPVTKDIRVCAKYTQTDSSE